MSVNVSRYPCYSIWCKGIEKNSRTPYAVAYAYVISIRLLGNAAFLDPKLWLMNWSFFYTFFKRKTGGEIDALETKEHL